ncbi:hypothetical protein KL928_004847 [Ogataea angusta]|uniref:FMP27 GFWDK domain-containing protein n=1 Tax=Pichia angusta TaxID=870730 RepID=A0AAN6DCD6_PICAN|nr:uncharacterized protein KL928_004847 [Ogataea angusta]KAG7816291.1 hypothetical protein KL928_004847 [Ogataea angusta]
MEYADSRFNVGVSDIDFSGVMHIEQGKLHASGNLVAGAVTFSPNAPVPVVAVSAVKVLVQGKSWHASAHGLHAKDVLDIPHLTYSHSPADGTRLEMPAIDADISLPLVFALLSLFVPPKSSSPSSSSSQGAWPSVTVANSTIVLHLASFDLRVHSQDLSFSATAATVGDVRLEIVRHGRWTRLLSVQNVAADGGIDVRVAFAKLSLPHGFLIYELFDSASNTAKSLQQHVHTLRTGSDELVIAPRARPPVHLSDIRVRAGLVAVCFENDPFETELGMIYQLGRVEQRSRLQKWGLLEGGEFLDALNEHISSSWIRLVREYRTKLAATVERNGQFLEGRRQPAATGAPVMSLYLEEVDINVGPPHMDESLPAYIERVGKGMPRDTQYTTLLPAYVDLSVGQVRAHLLELPLPLAWVPWGKNTAGLRVCGNVVLLEQLGGDWRWCDVEVEADKSVRVPRTMAAMKTLAELTATVLTDHPVMLTWGASIQPVLRQLSLCFDSFSKPRVDPSPKLGIWDKLRLIAHGHVDLVWATDAGLQINIKGSMDPYELHGAAAGFSFVFRKNVRLELNDPRNAPDDFAVVRASETMFGVPDHLTTLPCWCSADPVYLGHKLEKSLSTSTFGYYLNERLFSPLPPRTSFKQAVSLGGEVEFKLSFKFERSQNKATPHYAVHMALPPRSPNHDSYAGFRTNTIHMGIHLTTRSSANSVHVTPVTFSYFTKWFTLFSSGVSLPIRNGPLFGTALESVKFASHLASFSYNFAVHPLYIFHGYRLDLDDPENRCAIGFKAKMEDLRLQLHQRKKPMVLKNENLNKQVKLMQMRFDTGEVRFCNVDVRVVAAEEQKAGSDEFTPAAEPWFDRQDFEEHGMESLGAVSVEYLHLFHCEEMAYFLDHDSAKFRNIVEASRPLAKWNCAVRNRVFQYLQRLEFRHSYSYYRSYQAYRTARASQAQGRAKTAVHDDVSFADRSLRIDTFESDLRAVEHSARRLVTCDDFAVKISEPQIQLIENDAADYFVLLSTPQIDVSVVSVNDGSKLDDVGSRPLATRFGSVLKDTDIFLIDRSVDPKGAIVYGASPHWPLFLADPPAKYKVLARTAMVLRFDRTSSLGGDDRRNVLMFNMARLETRLDSAQARALYSLVATLLLYSEPRSKELNAAVQELAMVADSSDLDAVFAQVADVSRKLAYLPEPSPLRSRLLVELYTRMRFLVNGGGLRDDELEWVLQVGRIKMDMVEASRPFLQLEIAQGTFNRIELANGATTNRVLVGTLRARNMAGAYFPQLLSGVESTHMFEISWTMDRPVGGIRVVKRVDIKSSPIKLGLEETVGQRVLEYFVGEQQDGQQQQEEHVDASSSKLMISRAGRYYWFQSIHMEPVALVVSVRGKGLRKLLNVTDFELLLPALDIVNRLWGIGDLANYLKKYILQTLMVHFGKIIRHKMKKH